MKEQHKPNTEPTRKNIGDKHGPVVKSGFGHKVLPTVGAAFMHDKWLAKRKGWCLVQISFHTAGAFEPQHAVYF